MQRVARSRELGVLRLGQPLKSFRDHIGEFTIYQRGVALPYLDSLGPLIKPGQLEKLAELKIKESDIQVPYEPTGYKGEGTYNI
jgi:hypothetical protein